jgi:hypothetical protein
MHPELIRLLAEERRRELEDVRLRFAAPSRPRPPLRVRLAKLLLGSALTRDRRPRSDRLTIRPAQEADQAALARLAKLDEQPAPRGETLLAELDQRLVAALPLPNGPPLADPFLATEDVVLLLELRARQLAA